MYFLVPRTPESLAQMPYELRLICYLDIWRSMSSSKKKDAAISKQPGSKANIIQYEQWVVSFNANKKDWKSAVYTATNDWNSIISRWKEPRHHCKEAGLLKILNCLPAHSDHAIPRCLKEFNMLRWRRRLAKSRPLHASSGFHEKHDIISYQISRECNYCIWLS